MAMRAPILSVTALVATLVAAVTLGGRASDNAGAAWRGVPYDSVPDWRNYTGARDSVIPDVTVVFWADFTCRHCRMVAPLLRDFERRYAGEVEIVYRHLPLGATAQHFAVVAECARVLGAFEAIAAEIYERQDNLEEADDTAIARTVGISDVEGFAECVNHDEPLAIIRRDIEAARDLGIHGTPAILINDRLLRGTPNSDRLVRILNASATASTGLWSLLSKLSSERRPQDHEDHNQ